MAQRYPPYSVKPDPSRCAGCDFHRRGRRRLTYGRCTVTGDISAYYAQLVGYCVKIAEERKGLMPLNIPSKKTKRGAGDLNPRPLSNILLIIY